MDKCNTSVTIIIPTLNEELGVKKTICSIPKSKIYELGLSLEILVIDGNSTDSTRNIAEDMGAKVIVEKRLGYGRAYKTGLVEASGDIIITLDADGTYPGSLIPDYIQYLIKENMDFITINRFGKIENNAMSLVHRVGNKILSNIMAFLYSIDVKDSQSGMWVMKRDFAERINLQSNDMSMSEEIKIIAFKYFKACELDGMYFRRTGQAKLATFGHGWLNLRYLVSYRKSLDSAIKHLPLDKELEIKARISPNRTS